MDIEKLIERLKWWTEECDRTNYGCQARQTLQDAAAALSAFQAENEKLRNEVERQRRSADDRQHLYENAERAYINVQAELEQVRQERDAAVGDMEALMWYSGEGCQICANAVEVHKRPYVRLDCKLGSGIDCKPKWRGKKED